MPGPNAAVRSAECRTKIISSRGGYPLVDLGEVASRMNVSRQTFGRIIEVGAQKKADVLVQVMAELFSILSGSGEKNKLL